jgi:hypothetical protein
MENTDFGIFSLFCTSIVSHIIYVHWIYSTHRAYSNCHYIHDNIRDNMHNDMNNAFNVNSICAIRNAALCKVDVRYVIIMILLVATQKYFAMCCVSSFMCMRSYIINMTNVTSVYNYNDDHSLLLSLIGFWISVYFAANVNVVASHILLILSSMLI